MKKYSALLKQIGFYGIVGLVTLGIDVTITTTLYSVLHLPAYIASAIGFLSGFFFNFPINRKKVFHHSNDDRFTLHTQVVMFVSLSLFNLATTSALVGVMVTNKIVPIAFAKMIVTGLIAMWNFAILKKVIFVKVAS